MAITNTTRFSLTQWSSGDDDFTREQLTTDHASIGGNAALFFSGSSASPPSIEDANTKAFYWDNTNGILYYRGDTVGVSPSSWTQLHPVVPSAHVHSNLQPLNASLTSISGLTTLGFAALTASGTFSTRYIVVSGSGLSVSNPYGTAGNPTISINSDSNATANTVVFRDSSGQFKIGTPTAPEHATTKQYVDDADALKANSADVYSKSDIEGAKLYQYANEAGGTGAPLPASGTRTTPRIYVQSTEPSSAGAITGDIWFQI